jgi:F-type H+-transporting ATPase subunit epsilon
MADQLTLRIITPDRVVVEKPVTQVVARAIDGELAILPHHQPLLTALQVDVVRYVEGKEEHFAAVMGGVMEVANNEVTVLSDLAELDTEIDETKAHQEKARAEAEKLTKVDKLDVYVSEMAIGRSMARLKAADLGKRRKARGERMS